MYELIFLRYENLSSFCGWVKFDVSFFVYAEKIIDEKIKWINIIRNFSPIARSFNSK